MIATPIAPEPLLLPAFTPRGPLLHVRFLPVVDRWECGLHMPETMRINTSEAEVIGVGPGRALAGEDYRFRPWPRVGDIVVFEPHMARKVWENDAFIDAEGILGVVLGDGQLSPLSDWCLVKPERRPNTTAEGVRLSDRVQLWRTKGKVVSAGPGYLFVDGPCAVKRKTVYAIMNWPNDRPLIGSVVFWKRDARILEIGREVVDHWLVRAGALVAYEGD